MYIDHISQKLKSEYLADLADVIANSGEGSMAHTDYIQSFLATQVYGKEQLEFILKKMKSDSMTLSSKKSLHEELLFLEAMTFGNPKFNFS